MLFVFGCLNYRAADELRRVFQRKEILQTLEVDSSFYYDFLFVKRFLKIFRYFFVITSLSERKEAAIAYSHKDWDQVSDEEVFKSVVDSETAI